MAIRFGWGIRTVLSFGTAFVLMAAGLHGNGASAPPAGVDSQPPPRPLGTYTALPSADPDDGKFMSVAGEGLQTLAGLAVITYLGLPAGTPSFELGIFDGDTGGDWDTRSGAPTLNYRLYRDPLKTGSTSSLLWQRTSESMPNDDWLTLTFSTDAGARAPSGNYFYRLEANWADSASTSFNNFKIRTSGQISLKAGQEFGFTGGPQNIGGPNADPCVGSGDPNPGETNDPDANTYDGDWPWFFYVPTAQTSIAFRDGDSDRADDENSPGQPADDGTPYGACADVPPSIFYDITEPPDAAGVVHVYTNNNPSGNVEWEDFTIGPNANDDVVISYPLQPGLWKLRVQGMDAHNFNVLRASREVYTNSDPPLTVNPTPDLTPDNEKTTRQANVTMEYGHNVTNRGAPDAFDLRATSAHAWTTRIYRDANGNGKRDANESQITQTPTLGTNVSFPIVVQVDVPAGITGRLDDTTTVLASSRTEWALQDDATDLTHVLVNRPPVPTAGGPYVAPEGSEITFTANGSTDPDGDALTFRWDFQDDGTWDTAWSSAPYASYQWGDDWAGTVRVEANDGLSTANATASVLVTNVAPIIESSAVPSGDEGDWVTFKARILDPGSDDLTITWNGACTGWTPPTTDFNDPSVGPDPDPSPDVHPRDIRVQQTIRCGDDGMFAWSLRIVDDDGGVTTVGGTFAIGNLPPALAVSPPAQVTVDEGTQVALTAKATDPGSDDLTFAWAWQYFATDARTHFNDGAGPDPPNSPNGTYPFTATDTSAWTYGDDGTYTVSLTVTDDDGAFLTYTTTIRVVNVPPTVVAGPNQATDEATPVSVRFTFTDPGFDQPAVPTSETFTATIDWGYGAPEPAAVAWSTGSPGVPTTGTLDATHTYGDNGAFTVTATVCDDDGGCGSASLRVTVRNVAPVLEDLQVYVVADLTLRVAGEKWHDVRMDLVWNGDVTGTARVVRYPGSPDRQTATIEGGRLQLLGSLSIILYYTPADDPVNGQPNGANPVWVLLTMPDGSDVRLHHTFNVQHPSTWTWTIDDVRPYLVGQRITFDATASDVGSDDLTFAWEFGDGTAGVATTFFNNGVSPDPSVSPEVNPITANDVQTHAFVAAGTYTVTLTVTDDDGGITQQAFSIKVG